MHKTCSNLDSLKVKLSPWPEFKKVIFDIIDHRIEYASEINGAVNTSYMSMDEHLLVYLVQNSNIQQTSSMKFQPGTRDDIELRLVEFLYSLKYYSTRWTRARLYAEIAGFLQVASSHERNQMILKELNVSVPHNVPLPPEGVVALIEGVYDHSLEDIEIPCTDIYYQEFFFYAY